MTIKRRIFLYNTVSVVAALLAMLLVSGVVMQSVTTLYQKWTLSQVNSRLVEVQSLLENWDVTRQSWDKLDRELKESEYGLNVTFMGYPVYSSLQPNQTRALREMTWSTLWNENSTLVAQRNGMLMVGVRRGGYTLVAMPERSMPVILGSERLPDEAATLVLLICGLVAIAVISVLNLIFTSGQVKRIMAPVEALTQAAHRVEQGDLSQPVDYDSGDEFTSVCTAFNQMQAHLLAEREKTAAYERARTDLVSGISHDLRTPLTSVKGYIKGLQDGVAKTPERQAQYLDIAYRKACDMDVLLQRLFYFSKLETGSLPLFLQPTDFGTFLTRFVEESRMELEQQGHQITLALPQAPCPVLLDGEQMYRVLTNLKDNALRYAQVDPLVLSLTLEQEGDSCLLRFADNGVGVPEDQLPHLFEQFWRADQARQSKGGEGSGLGLYIVKYIVEAHGGTVAPEHDGGLVFSIRLPRKEEHTDV